MEDRKERKHAAGEGLTRGMQISSSGSDLSWKDGRLVKAINSHDWSTSLEGYWPIEGCSLFAPRRERARALDADSSLLWCTWSITDDGTRTQNITFAGVVCAVATFYDPASKMSLVAHSREKKDTHCYLTILIRWFASVATCMLLYVDCATASSSLSHEVRRVAQEECRIHCRQ